MGEKHVIGMFSHAPSISHLCMFGLKCFIKVPDKTQSKLDDKAKECHFMGFEGESIQVVMDADRKKLCSHNVIFMEGQVSHSDGTGPMTMEFQSQDTEAAKDDYKGTHSADDEVSK